MRIRYAIRGTLQDLHKLVRREVNFHRVRPTHALIFLTYRCSSRCQTCEIWKWKDAGIAVKERELGLEDWKRFVDMLVEMEISNVELFGGDALLRRDILPELVRYLCRSGIQADLVTNSLSMDRQLAQELVEAGLRDIAFSVDGVGETHDRVRGVDGSFERVKAAIRHVLEARGDSRTPGVICNCTISALNVDSFEQVVPFAAEMGADDVHLEYAGGITAENARRSVVDGITARPLYRAEPGESFLLDRDQAIMLKRKLVRLKESARDLPCEVSTRNIDVLTVDNLVNSTFPNKKCYMIRYFIAVDPYGNIVGCPFFTNYLLGNVRDEPIRSIWSGERHRRFIEAQERGEIAMCKNCIMGVQRNRTFLKSLLRLSMYMRDRWLYSPRNRL